MEQELIESQLTPLDKSWINRMGILDLANGREEITSFLDKQKNLGDDLLALQRAVKVWKTDEPVDVGESGTLYRFLRFLSWKQGLDKKFIKSGTLKDRKITDDPAIVDWPLEKLLELDNRSSQWASASVLAGNKERIANPPFKLAVSYEAVEHWNECRDNDEPWQPRFDETILNQALAYVQLLKKEKAYFVPEQSEDFCFAYTFGFMTAEEGDEMWPNLRGNESDRTKEMQEVLLNAKEGKAIDSKDHRAVQAIVMWGKVNNKEVNILHPEVVNKSWPQFWDFIHKFS